MKATIIIITTILLYSACSRSQDPSVFGDVKICSSKDYRCKSHHNSIDKHEQNIYANINLKTFANSDVVKASWQYYNGDNYYEIYTQTQQYKSGELSMRFILERPSSGWPLGKYNVVFTLNANKDKVKICPFEIK
jgi:hypothetical protein